MSSTAISTPMKGRFALVVLQTSVRAIEQAVTSTLATGGRLLTDRDVEREQDAEMHRIDADLAHQRHEDRHRQDDRRRAVQHHPHEEQEHVDDHQDGEAVLGDAGDPLREDAAASQSR